MGPESTLRSRVLAELRHAHRSLRIWGWPASVFTGRGHPDLFGVVKGRFFALELKTRTGRATRAQQLAIRDIRKVGGYAWVVRSVQQATMAVAWTLEGKHPPMPEEALNIDDWFKELDQPEEAVATAEPLEELPTFDDVAPGDDGAVAPEVIAEFELDANGGQPEVIEVTTKLLDGVLRTLGDRITLCYQSLNRIENMLLQLSIRHDKLLALVMEEDLPEAPPEPEPLSVNPPKRRRSRTVLPSDSQDAQAG